MTSSLLKATVSVSILAVPILAKSVPLYTQVPGPLIQPPEKRSATEIDCHPNKLILPDAVIQQTRDLASYMKTHRVRHQKMWDTFWQKVTRQQDYLIRACYDDELSIDHLSGQGLLPYLLSDQMPREYSTLVDHGMPENQVNELTIFRWMERLSEPEVTSEGELIGCRDFAELDPGWLLTGVSYAAQAAGQLNRASFNSSPGRGKLQGDQLKLVLMGDWGTDTASARAVMTAIKQENADIVTHLGDVYYSGTVAEEESRFLPGFHSGITKALRLNANHEMDGGGLSYFSSLSHPVFSLQQNSSFFALEYGNWVIIGLDSAYYASGVQYKPGRITDQGQIKLLQEYRDRNSSLILLSHHNPISVEGDSPLQLWTDVADALNSQMPAYWYYGHKHAGVVYSGQSHAGLNHTHARCVGHSGMPIGRGAGFFDSDGSLRNTIDFYAHTPDAANTPQVTNGYMVLTINGEQVTEEYYDQNRQLQWPASLSED
ncbi:MAG: metallophosphoesterase family protein [Endozoicomonas sp.]